MTGGGHRPAVLPEVFAHGHRDVDAEVTHDRQLVAATEVAELVEDAVVGQVVLGVASDDLTAKQEGGRVAR